MNHFLTPLDRICFGGPVLIDKGNWLEVHPIEDFRVCPAAVPPSGTKTDLRKSPDATPPGEVPASKDIYHTVVKDEGLSKIAEQNYGLQNWRPLYVANRTKIKHAP